MGSHSDMDEDAIEYDNDPAGYWERKISSSDATSNEPHVELSKLEKLSLGAGCAVFAMGSLAAACYVIYRSM